MCRTPHRTEQACADHARVLLTLAIYPAFVLLNKSPTTATLLSVVTAFSIVHSLNGGTVGAMLGELFPRSVVRHQLVAHAGAAQSIVDDNEPAQMCDAFLQVAIDCKRA